LLRRELDWRPLESLDKGLGEVARWFRTMEVGA